MTKVPLRSPRNFLKHTKKWSPDALRDGCGVPGGLSTPGQV